MSATFKAGLPGHAPAVCFSATADLAAGAALTPIAVLSLREVKQPREVPFALLPTIFAVHQFIEAFVWVNQHRSTPSALAQPAVMAYLLIAFSLLPTLVPSSVLLLEPRGARRRVTPFVGLGMVVSAYLTFALLTKPIGVQEHPHALSYQTGVQNAGWWAALYIVAVIGPAVLSGYTSIVWFGLINLVGLVVVAVVYAQAFASLWCIYAAAASVLVLVHMICRRRLPDPHRHRGVPMHQLVSADT